MTLRIIFMGTPDFSLPTLQALARAGHEICAVYCQPPRKKGRGHQVQECPIHAYARAQGWPVHTPQNFKDPSDVARFKAYQADVAVVVAYGLLLPLSILQAPMRGCINVHASLLPRWRGAAPIQRAIEAGDQQTGVSIMQMELGLDTGPVIAQRSVPISSDETAASLHDKLAQLGAELCAHVCEQASLSALWIAQRQDDSRACYAAKLSKEQGLLDFCERAEVLERKIRAFTPFPGSYFFWQGQLVKVLRAAVENLEQTEQTACASVLDDQLLIACADNTALRLLELQRAGKKALPAADFLRGLSITQGASLNQNASGDGRDTH